MTIASGAGVGCPGVIKSVAFDLERTAGATQFVSHLLEESFKWGLLYFFQFASQSVSCIMVTTEKEKEYRFKNNIQMSYNMFNPLQIPSINILLASRIICTFSEWNACNYIHYTFPSLLLQCISQAEGQVSSLVK